MITGRDITTKFSQCAIVGDGTGLVGTRKGIEIDSHETVIRISYLPTSGHFADVGKKTDIYYAGIRDSADRFLKEGYDVQYMGRERARCPWCDGRVCSDLCWQAPHSICKYQNDTCPFRNLVLNTGLTKNAQRWEPTWKP